MTAAERRVPIARVGRPHGVQGEVRVVPYNAESRLLAAGSRVELALAGGERRLAQIEALRSGAGALLARFQGVAGRDAAAALTGAVVEVPRSALPPLEPGEYYLGDLVGAVVEGPAGPLGEVIEIRVHPSVDSAVIRRADGTLVEQPLVPPWVEAVDVEGARLTLASLDGLIE